MLTTWLGFQGATLALIMWLPQARRTWQTRHHYAALSQLSVGTFAINAVNVGGWMLYAALTGAWWVGVSGVVNLPMSLWTISLILRARSHKEAGAL